MSAAPDAEDLDFNPHNIPLLVLLAHLAGNYKRSVRDEVKRRLAVQYSFLTSVARGGDVLPQQLSQLLPSMLRLAEEAQLESAVYGELGKVGSQVGCCEGCAGHCMVSRAYARVWPMPPENTGLSCELT